MWKFHRMISIYDSKAKSHFILRQNTAIIDEIVKMEGNIVIWLYNLIYPVLIRGMNKIRQRELNWVALRCSQLWQAQCPAIRKSWNFAKNPGLSVDCPRFLIDNPSFSMFF